MSKRLLPPFREQGCTLCVIDLAESAVSHQARPCQADSVRSASFTTLSLLFQGRGWATVPAIPETPGHKVLETIGSFRVDKKITCGMAKLGFLGYAFRT